VAKNSNHGGFLIQILAIVPQTIDKDTPRGQPRGKVEERQETRNSVVKAVNSVITW